MRAQLKQFSRPVALLRRLQTSLWHKIAHRRLVRYGLLCFNVALLLGIVGFIWQSGGSVHTLHRVASVASTDTATNPLDQLSSADIAVNLARMTNLPEATAVTNQADSVSAELAIAPSGDASVARAQTTADSTVVVKPQVAATALKSRKDIQTYVAQAGDTVTGIAAKFNVTSDSIIWSNNLNGNTVNPGTKLLIPPINGIVYTVRSGDTADNLAARFRANKDQVVVFNDIEITGLKPGEQILIPNGQQQVGAAGRSSGSFFSALPSLATFGDNGYDRGWCTWYAAKRRADLGRPVPSNLGNANTWAGRAADFGIPTGAEPKVGAVAMKHSGLPGHVAIVELVNGDGSFWVSEMNSYGQRSMTDSTPTGGWGVVDWKPIGADLTGTYTYIY